MLPNRFAPASDLIKQRPLLIACLCAIIAALFASGYLSHRETAILKISEPVSVVVASRDIASGETIDEGSITIGNVPARFVQPGAFSSIEEAAGRVAMIPLRTGAHITPASARRAGESRGLSGIIPAGMRAVAVPIDDAMGFIRPNDMVDVIATFDLGQDASVKRTTMTVVENVQVLSIGNEVADAVPRSPSRKSGGGILGENQNAPSLSRQQLSATLAVTPQEAQAIAFAKESGALALALRPFGDDTGSERTPPTTIATITGGHDDLIPMKRGFREYKGR